MIENIGKIHSFAERLLLGENTELGKHSYTAELDYALNHAYNILNSKDEYHEYNKFELRLRLAMHFSPLEAINFESSSDYTRAELISFHLQEYFNKTPENADKLAEVIVNILEIWENKREDVGIHRKTLLKKQGYKCNHCRVKFTIPDNARAYKVNTVFKNDKYKPYSYPRKEITDGYIEYLTTEVDHIKPVSALGSNNLDNLQVLCKLCNQAKSNILSVKTLNEIKYAGYSIEDIMKEKPTHIHKMLYFTILKANKECELCKTNNNELTMRKIIKTGPFTRSNMQAVCLKCAKKIDKT